VGLFMPCILVVDDQKEVRATICLVLRMNRFDVVEAASEAAGLQAFGERHCDAAIVDLFLEDSSGLELIARLRERVPDLPVIAVSGMAAFDGAKRRDDLARVVYLQKPFRPAELIGAIAAARAAVQVPEVQRAAV
jgi:DNA-binding response OmpR family regulator